jgi:hypothetical protein
VIRAREGTATAGKKAVVSDISLTRPQINLAVELNNFLKKSTLHAEKVQTAGNSKAHLP